MLFRSLKTYIPNLVFTQTQNDVIDAIESALNNILIIAQANMITGTGGENPYMNNSWNSLLNDMQNAGNIKGKGYETLMAKYQEAYETYLSKK